MWRWLHDGGRFQRSHQLAAHLKLSNLCWIYDNNHITIEGHTRLAFTEDVAARFLGYSWNVTRISDANDLEMLTRAYQIAQNTTDRPTLIIVDSHIGYGAPHKQDTSEAHGEPLGSEEVRLAKEFFGWNPDAQFLVPDGVQTHFQAQLGQRGAELPANWDHDLPTFPPDPKGVASRDVSSKVLNAIAARVP